MKKQFLSLALAAVMLTGCAGKESSSSDTENAIAGTDAGTVSGVTESSVSKPEKDVTITIAVSGETNAELMQHISDFNAEDNGYFIKTKNYTFKNDAIDPEVYRQNMYSADFEFLQDMLNTDDIDIVYSGSYVNGSSYESLKSKGAFVDLYPFMENDSEVNPAALNSHILELNETDGKLYGFPTFYCIETLAGREELVGDKENWTVDELLEKWNDAPSGTTLSASPYAESAFLTLIRYIEQFVDYDNAEVNFDSEDFRKLLEFCGSFPSNGNQKYEEIDWNSIFVLPYNFEGIVSASVFNDTYSHRLLGSGNYTLAGYPTSDECGAYFLDSGWRFSICANSSYEEQHGAWEFIRRFYTYDYQKEHDIITAKNVIGQDVFSSERGLCINEKAFDDIACEIVSGKYYGELNAALKEDWQKWQIPTEEDCQELRRYISETKKWLPAIDTELRDIVNEEVMNYLGGGQSLDTTIDLIQDRASVWIAE